MFQVNSKKKAMSVALIAGWWLAVSGCGTELDPGAPSSHEAPAAVETTEQEQVSHLLSRHLGGLDLNSYCRSAGYAGVRLLGATAYDWRCVTQTGGLAVISMTRACRWQYADAGAFDRLANYFDPFTWQCWTNGIHRGGLDLYRYCRASGYADVSLDGSTAYDWRCVTLSGGRVRISMTSACKWQYRDSGVIDRMGNYFDPYSWQCWG